MESTNLIAITTEDGLRGHVNAETQPVDGSRPQVLVEMDDGREVLVPVELLKRETDRRYYLPVSLGQWKPAEAQLRDHNTLVLLPVAVEELEVTKRRVRSGGVRLTKRVHEEQKLVDEPAIREHVEVERVPVNRPLESVAAVRYEGETIVIPIMEEVLSIEKKLILKEEVRITKRREEIRNPQQVTLRREEAIIEPIEGESSPIQGD